jgi:hypothetical protein
MKVKEKEMNQATQTKPVLYPTATVRPWGFDIHITFDYEPGEPPIYSPIDEAHPGSEPYAVILNAQIGGVEVYEMLTSGQLETLEAHALRAMGD